MGHKIKRGIMICDWHRQVEAKKMTWEDCIEAAVKMGCNGLELLGQIYFRYCPEALKEDIDSWEELMWKYGTKMVAHDFFLDNTLYAHRKLTVKECVDIVRRHAQFAKFVHCSVVCINGQVSSEVFRQSIPVLEDLGIKMGLEIHSGFSSFDMPRVQDVIEIIQKSGSKYIGIVPDMSLFCKKISQKEIAFALSEGVDEKLVEEVECLYRTVSNGDFHAFCNEQMILSKNKATKSFLERVCHKEYHDPKILREHIPYIVHCHGKFYEMTESCEEATLDYPGVLKILAEGGYEGYVSAKYAGDSMNKDIFEPFRRYQKMLDKYLGTYPDANYPYWPSAEPLKSGFGVADQALLPQGFKNHYEDGKCTGFEVQVSNYEYRGVPLSLFESCYIEVNGRLYGPDWMRVAVDGEVFRFADMCDITLHYWNKGCPATIIIDKPGGLKPGCEYDISAMVIIRKAYTGNTIGAFVERKLFKMPPPLKCKLEA